MLNAAISNQSDNEIQYHNNDTKIIIIVLMPAYKRATKWIKLK
jgi:hypothetical protein